MAIRDILPNSIASIRGLTERPVYFVTFVNEQAPALVVKGENIASESSAADVEVSVRWATKMMKNVNNPLVNSRALSPAEWDVFRRKALPAFAPDTPQAINLTRGNYVWTKMPFVAGLTDAEILNSEGIAETKLLKEVLRKFLIDRNWEELGKVVAVDCFNTNWDRFSIEPSGQVLWANRGNIMFAGGSVIGLDAYFADRGDSNLNRSRLQNLHDQGQSVRAGLDLLRDRVRRPLFAKACTDAVAAELERRMRAVQSKFVGLQKPGINSVKILATNGAVLTLTPDSIKGIFDDFANDFLNGFSQGANDLKLYLLAKKTKYGLANLQGGASPVGLPAGIVERMTYLGW